MGGNRKTNNKEENNMQIFKIFSKREKERRGEVPDGYQYGTIPPELRAQVIHIWEDAYGPDNPLHGSREVYEGIRYILLREYGQLTLGGDPDYPYEEVRSFFLETEEAEKTVDVIEISFKYIDDYVRDKIGRFRNSQISPDDAISELNHRFREHGVGFQFESGQIIRVDSEFLHSEAMKPTLRILSDPMYAGANEEFLKAHKHYRAKRYQECMNECLKAFESCIKTICTKRRWKYKETDSINRLIDIVFDKEVIPAFIQSHFTALKSTLVSGAPTIRNRRSGHGQGPTQITVPESLATYMLHLTASNILFLAKADEEM